MQIVIPMSGIGERFLRYGIETPKPLIKVDGKPIIHHVIEMFPGEKNFIFICNEEHLANKKFMMKEIIKAKAPEAKIISIKPHKLGPVYAVSKVFELINDNEPIIVNYCDFTCDWDYRKFKKKMIKEKYDGCIPAYRNFHPHSLWGNNYAFIKEENLLVRDIQEKLPFTDNRMKEFASSGTYYFKTGSLMMKSMQYCFDNKLIVNNEYYVSMAFKYLINKNKRIFVYELAHFMQWGTPEDLNEYISWSEIFKDYPKNKPKNKKIKGHAIIMPMAGLGQRFQEEGYHTPKSLIKVKEKPMFEVVLDDLPKSNIYVFVVRKNMKDLSKILKRISKSYPDSILKILDKESGGQAISCLEGVNALLEKYPNFDGPITFTSCDTGLIYDWKKFSNWVEFGKSDILVWGAVNHPTAVRFPNMFGWIDVYKKKIKSVSVKKPLNNPKTDSLITGTFSYRKLDVFKKSVKSLIKRNEKVNGEYYLDSSINDSIKLKFICELFLVKKHISWGTPNDLETYKYWEKCFSKWNSHEFKGY